MDTHPRSTSSKDRSDEGGALLYRVEDVIPLLNLHRTVIFELIRTGRLRSVKQGRSRRIPASALREYVALLEQEAEAA